MPSIPTVHSTPLPTSLLGRTIPGKRGRSFTNPNSIALLNLKKTGDWFRMAIPKGATPSQIANARISLYGLAKRKKATIRIRSSDRGCFVVCVKPPTTGAPQ